MLWLHEHKEGNLELSWKLPPCCLTLIVPNGVLSLQAAGGEKSPMVLPNGDPAFYNNDSPSKIPPPAGVLVR